MVSGRPQVTDRQVSKTLAYAKIVVNRFSFRLGNYHRMYEPVQQEKCRVRSSDSEGISILSPDQSWKMPIDSKGRYISAAGLPIPTEYGPASIKRRSSGNLCNINYFHYAIAIDPKEDTETKRKTTNDPYQFFRGFLEAVRTGQTFNQVLAAKTNDQGVVLFSKNRRSKIAIPCPASITREKVGAHISSKVYFVPQRINGAIVMRTFSKNGTYLGEFEYDIEHRLFFYTNQLGERVYIAALKKKGLIFETKARDHTFRFGSVDRRENEAMRLCFDGDKFIGLAPYTGSHAKNLVHEDPTAKKVVVVGLIQKVEKRSMGQAPIVKILNQPIDIGEGETRPRYYFKFARKNPYWIPLKTMERYELAEEQELRVVQIDDKVVALVDDTKKSPARIPLIQIWKGTRQGFVLDDTTFSDIVVDKMTGCRAVLHTHTSPHKAGDFFIAGGKRKRLTDFVPFYVAPEPLSILVRNGDEVLFFRYAEEFSDRDWEVAKLAVRAEKRDNTIIRDPNMAEESAVAADEALSVVKSDIMNATHLEVAYTKYIDAFLFDPQKRYLKQAMAIQNTLIVRKRHLARREYFEETLRDTFDNASESDQSITSKLADLVLSDSENPTSIAYLLEIIYRKARGGDRDEMEKYQRIFKCLPAVLNCNETVSHKLMGALRLLLSDKRLSCIPKWIIIHPTPGNEALFMRRKVRMLGLPRDLKISLSWKKPAKQTAPQTAVKPMTPTGAKRAAPAAARSTNVASNGTAKPSYAEVWITGAKQVIEYCSRLEQAIDRSKDQIKYFKDIKRLLERINTLLRLDNGKTGIWFAKVNEIKTRVEALI